MARSFVLKGKTEMTDSCRRQGSKKRCFKMEENKCGEWFNWGWDFAKRAQKVRGTREE